MTPMANETIKEKKNFVYGNILLGNKDDNDNSRPAARNWRHTQ